MPRDAACPPGWRDNPSRWRGRLVLAALSTAGFFVAGYLALYQLGITDTVWDPLFDGRATDVLTSQVSRSFPVPDAVLGAIGYLAELGLGLLGGRDRWRSLPVAVLAFGLMTGSLGLTAVLLLIAQPVFVGSWCTLCATSGLISLLIVGPAMTEVLATLQFLRREHDAGAFMPGVLIGAGVAGTPLTGA